MPRCWSAFRSCPVWAHSSRSIAPARLQPAAEAVDAQRQAGQALGPLAGLPILVKDNINTAALPTTGATPGLAGFGLNGNAPVLQVLPDAGAIVLGEANMHAATIVCVHLVGMLAGVFASVVLPVYGWCGLFMIGGSLPLASGVLRLFKLHRGAILSAYAGAAVITAGGASAYLLMLSGRAYRDNYSYCYSMPE